MTFTARPRAKVNLALSVGPRGADGYHPLRSVFLRIGLSDRLVVAESSGPDGADRLAMDGLPGATVEGNIVLRALALLRRQVALPLPPLDVKLEKLIPVGGGLGGGSSDAAATLAVAGACWGLGMSAAAFVELAAQLGSDVPFFAAGAAAALVEGKGERVEPLPGITGQPGVLVVTPPIELSTAAVFARHDEIRSRPGAMSSALTDELAAALRAGLDTNALLARTPDLRDANDLWPAAASLVTDLASHREQLEARTGRPWLLSGSGSSLFSLYASPSEAAEAGRRLVARADALSGALLHAVDLDGPDSAWRHP